MKQNGPKASKTRLSTDLIPKKRVSPLEVDVDNDHSHILVQRKGKNYRTVLSNIPNSFLISRTFCSMVSKILESTFSKKIESFLAPPWHPQNDAVFPLIIHWFPWLFLWKKVCVLRNPA